MEGPLPQAPLEGHRPAAVAVGDAREFGDETELPQRVERHARPGGDDVERSDPRQVAAIAFDSQMAGVGAYGDDLAPVAKFDSWLDMRCEPFIRQLEKDHGKRITELTGGIRTGDAAGSRGNRRSFQGADTTALHTQNFVKQLRTGTRNKVDGITGHTSTAACHLGTIAAKVGRRLHWDADREECINDCEASALLTRVLRKPYDLIEL